MMKIMPFTRVATRGFRTSQTLFKDDKKALVDLGLNLQKGNLKKKKGDEDTDDTEAKKALLLDTNQGTPQREETKLTALDLEVTLDASISEVNEKVSRMSLSDLQIAKNFNLGRGMFAQDHGQSLDRRALIREIPDEIDLADKNQMIKLNDTYKKLTLLDTDRDVHNKYFRRYLGTDDEFTVMQQDLNNIGAKFKLLRRGQQQLDLSLDGVMFEPHVNNFNLPHNVVGVDCTLNGLPLYKLSRGRAFLPQEFVRDLQPFETKVVVHKRDADFVEEDGGVMQEYHSKNSHRSKRSFETDDDFTDLKSALTEVLNSVSPLMAKSIEIVEVPSKKSVNSVEKTVEESVDAASSASTEISETISETTSTDSPSLSKTTHYQTSSFLPVENIHNYNIINLHSHRNPRGILPDLIKMEVLAIQLGLQHEIEQVMTIQANVKSMFYGSKPFKVNAFKLRNKVPAVDAFESALTYYHKDFNLLPNYSLILNSLAQLNRLRTHLLKIFLINLQEHIEILFRIKYDTELKQNKFMEELVRDINEKVINDRLIPKFDTLARKNIYSKQEQVSRAGYDALIHSPYKNGPFKRIYWLNNKFTKKNRRRAHGDKSSMRILTSRFDGFAWY